MMRRDAAVRRTALIEAAAECFYEGGYSVPLEEIAERAGVGRGTLYRNFKDRLAIVVAIMEDEIARMQGRFDSTLPLDRAIAQVVLDGAQACALFTKLTAESTFDGDNLAVFEQLATKIEPLLQPAVAKAHADGSLRPDVDARQLVIVVRMLSCLIYPHMSVEERRDRIEEPLSLLMTGLRTR